MTEQITRAAFRAWLAEQAGVDRVFRRVPHVAPEFAVTDLSWACGCPLATYCREVLDMPKVAWARQKITDYGMPGASVTLMAGPWATEFEMRVDGGLIDGTVTAHRALSELDRCGP